MGYELVESKQVTEQTLAGLRKIPFRQVLDIGANRGDFVLYIRRLINFEEMHCFEPLAEPFAELEALVNRLSTSSCRIIAHNLALGSEEGESTIHFHTEHSASSSLLPSTEKTAALFPIVRSQRECTIKVARLDEFVSRNQLSILSPCLIKMDVQGFEDRVLRGGRQTISQADGLLIEINFEHLYADQATFKDLLLELDQLGFSYRSNLAQLYTAEGRIVSADCLFYGKKFSAAL